MIQKVISGGQTGVDRAALDVAIKFKIAHGGWCPKGRKAEDGIIPQRYELQETPSEDYRERTLWNIRDSDGTLVIVPSLPINTMNGTSFTLHEARQLHKPLFIVELLENPSKECILDWIQQHHIQILNIAGSRESQSPGIYQLSHAFLESLLYFQISPK